MSGADPTADLFFHLEFAALLAVVALWQTWTWLSVLVCIPLGAILRAFYERRSAMMLGIVLVIVLVALNTALIGFDLAGGPDFVRSVWPAYFFPLVLMLTWLIHLPIGLLALGLGIGAAELIGRPSRRDRQLGIGDRPGERPEHDR